jgi:hypothetical protein
MAVAAKRKLATDESLEERTGLEWALEEGLRPFFWG